MRRRSPRTPTRSARPGTTRAGSGFTPCWSAVGGRCWPRSCGPATPVPTTPTITWRSSRRRSSSCPPAALDGPILARSDSAGASHALADACRETRVRFSFGYAIDERVRAAILALPESAWRPAINADGQPREGAWVAELTGQVALDGWPEDSRLIVRRERPHPGAQLTFTDVDGHRFQCFITDQADRDLAGLETRHRAHAIVEDRVRDLKSTGLSNLPFSAFKPNQAWLQAALVAHDLTVGTQQLLFDGEHAVCEPKRLRYRLLHVAGRLTRHARRLTLHLPADWPWAGEIARVQAPRRAPRLTRARTARRRSPQPRAT